MPGTGCRTERNNNFWPQKAYLVIGRDGQYTSRLNVLVTQDKYNGEKQSREGAQECEELQLT